MDSKYPSRVNALVQVKQLLLEEIVYTLIAYLSVNWEKIHIYKQMILTSIQVSLELVFNSKPTPYPKRRFSAIDFRPGSRQGKLISKMM